MRFMLIAVIAVASVFPTHLLAQASVSLPIRPCPGATGGTTPVLYAFASVQVAGVPIPMFTCVKLGVNLVLDTTQNPPVLNGAAQGAVTIPKMVIDSVPLSTIPSSQATLSYQLVKLPAPGTVILLFYNSSFVGTAKTVAVDPFAQGNTQPQQLAITLPQERPFTADDVVTIVYWSLQ